MVLEGASEAASPDSFDDGAATSNDGHYPTAQSYPIDLTSLPRGIPIIGPLIGYNEKYLENTVREKLKLAIRTIKRPLTRDEADALAYWTAKRYSIYSYAAPLGIAGGWARAYSTAGTFRFPFWLPNPERFQPKEFVPWLSLLRGNRAVVAWHLTRMLAYGTVGCFVGQAILGPYATSVGAMGEITDGRLKVFMDVARAQLVDQKRGEPRSPKQRGMSQQKDNLGKGQHDRDQASPTGGNYGHGTADQGDSYGGMGDGNTQDKDQGSTSWDKPPAAPPKTETSAKLDEGFGVFDDSPSKDGQRVSVDTAPQQGGSAWDRVRRGENPAANGRSRPSRPSQPIEPAPSPQQGAWSRLRDGTSQGQQDGSTNEDSFAFSATDRDRGLAKAQAQKEFDAQIDKERRGGDFDSSHERQRRW